MKMLLFLLNPSNQLSILKKRSLSNQNLLRRLFLGAILCLNHGKHIACAAPAVWGSLEDTEALWTTVKKAGLVLSATDGATATASEFIETLFLRLRVTNN
jgi:hypothetical protein